VCSYRNTSNSFFFFVGVDVKNIEAKAFGVLLDVPVPFPLKKPEICKDPDSGVKCPLKKDVEVEYKVTFFVEKATPAVCVSLSLSLFLFKLLIYLS